MVYLLITLLMDIYIVQFFAMINNAVLNAFVRLG